MDEQTKRDLNESPMTTWREGLQLLIWGWGQDTVLDYDTIKQIVKAVEFDLLDMMIFQEEEE